MKNIIKKILEKHLCEKNKQKCLFQHSVGGGKSLSMSQGQAAVSLNLSL